MSPDEWKQELTRAARRLRRAPGFTAIVVLTLALGVGVNTAIFTVLNAVLLQELPYGEPDRLVRMYEKLETWSEDGQFLRAPAIAEYRTWVDVFENVAAFYSYREVGADLTDGDVPQRVSVLRVSSGYFETLGRPPLMGRTFVEDESYGPGESASTTEPIVRVAILSHRLWESRYSRSATVVGQEIQLDGASFEIVGVMPGSFRDPIGTQADVWVPQDLRPGRSNNFGNFYLSGIARLRDGITLEAAQERLVVLSEGFAEAEPDRSLALRSALGSGRGRLMAGILAENGLLATAGGTLGLVFGWLGVRGLLGVAPDALPMVSEVRVGIPVFLFALGVTAAALLIFGLTPALRMSRTAPAEVLRSGDRASTMSKAVRRLRDGLVVIQVAAALMLVAGAMLLTRSFNSLLDVPLNFEPEGVLTYEVHLPAARNRFFRQLQEQVAALPGVEAVGATSWLPVNGRYHEWTMYWDAAGSEVFSNRESWVGTDVRIIEGDYFGTLGIAVLRGDPPAAIDLIAEPVLWINQRMAEEVFAEVDPIGEMAWLAGESRRIVGVIEDIPFSARGNVSRKSYVPHLQEDSRKWALIQTVKARGDLNQLRETIRAELQQLDPNLVLYRPMSFSSVLAVVRAQDKFATLLMGAFALLALALSVVGTYGVLSGSVAGHTREIGIRMALGADAGSVRAMVLRYAVRLTVPGVALGLAGAWLGSRSIQALLFGVEAGDPISYAGAALVFVAVGAVVSWIPAQRATHYTMRALAPE